MYECDFLPMTMRKDLFHGRNEKRNNLFTKQILYVDASREHTLFEMFGFAAISHSVNNCRCFMLAALILNAQATLNRSVHCATFHPKLAWNFFLYHLQ